MVDNTKPLSHLFRLLPFCDYEYNTISNSPNTEEALDATMTKSDIANLLNLDLKAYEKVERSLMDLKITMQGDVYYVMGSVTFGRGREKKKFYVINPLSIIVVVVSILYILFGQSCLRLSSGNNT